MVYENPLFLAGGRVGEVCQGMLMA
jgi:hypothetical protein